MPFRGFSIQQELLDTVIETLKTERGELVSASSTAKYFLGDYNGRPKPITHLPRSLACIYPGQEWLLYLYTDLTASQLWGRGDDEVLYCYNYADLSETDL